MEPSKTIDSITVKAIVKAPIEKVWAFWNDPDAVRHWNNASDDWHCPSATNDLEVGKRFSYRMAAKDGSFAFDFGGTYTAIDPQRSIAYTIDDGRKVEVWFDVKDDGVEVTERFDAEGTHSLEMQQAGWQAILDNFKRWAESQA